MTISLALNVRPIYGLGGNDRLTGGPFADQIYGGEGQDRINATLGADHYVGGGEGENSLYYRSPDFGPISADFTTKSVTLSDGTVHTFEGILAIHATHNNDQII